MNRLNLTIAGFALALFVHNLSPYVGLRDDSCQAMFSRLDYRDGRSNNHLVLPQHALWDGWRYHDDLTVAVSPTPAGDAATVHTWLTRPDKRRNTRAVRTAVRHLCRSGHQVALEVRQDGVTEAIEDACSEPRFSEPRLWIPTRLFETDIPTGGW